MIHLRFRFPLTCLHSATGTCNVAGEMVLVVLVVGVLSIRSIIKPTPKAVFVNAESSLSLCAYFGFLSLL